MKLVLAGALLMLAAVALELAMVVRLLEPSLVLGLAGYAVLFVGMALAVTGTIARRR